MFSIDDTIVAIATPPGRGGIGVVRLSGPRSHAIVSGLVTHRNPFEPRHATWTIVCGPAPAEAPREALDQAIVTYFPAPASYTGDDVVEVSVHGSPVVLRQIVEWASRAGARLAAPGEFTLRAFLNGRIDLPQAEAVADLIDAATPLQARAAFDQLQGTVTGAIAALDAELFDLIAQLEASIDFPDEGYHFVDPGAVSMALARLEAQLTAVIDRGRRGRLIREGYVVAIVGPPNVGKSSLFNAFVGSARAIVTAVPGTTRDLVSETVDVDGFRVTLIDTAGLHESSDVVESEGMARSLGAAKVADVVIEVRDGSADGNGASSHEGLEGITRVLVENKCDLPGFRGSAGALPVSALTGDGLDRLRCRIRAAVGAEDLGERPEITNVRHLGLLDRARHAIAAARGALANAGDTLSEEFILADLQVAQGALEEVSGKRTSDDLLTHIFQRFCIGK
jgi:tRNA modification GTPase